MPDEDLVDKVEDKESRGFMRKAFDLGFNVAYAAGATALALSIPAISVSGPMIGAALGSGLFLGGLANKDKSSYEAVNDGIKAYAGINMVLYPMVWLGDVTYPLLDYGANIGTYIAKSAYSLTAYLGVFMGLFRANSHLMDHKLNPIGMGESLTEGFSDEYRRLAWVFAPGLILTANGVPWLPFGNYEIHTFAANALPAGLINGYSPWMKPAVEPKHEDTSPSASHVPPNMHPQLQPGHG